MIYFLYCRVNNCPQLSRQIIITLLFNLSVYLMAVIDTTTSKKNKIIQCYTNKIKICLRLLDCNRGSYGIACREICGQCRDVNHCLHINGTCLTGCSAGYQGTLCKESK